MSGMTRDMWHTRRTSSKKDKTHPAKTLGSKKTSPLAKKGQEI